MKATVIHEHGGIEKLRYEDLPEPEIGPRDLLVKIAATTVNRIDFFVRSGYPGVTFKFPHIPGGDIAGTVAAVGARVRAFKRGDRVIAWPLIACGQCEMCQDDRRALCLNWQYFGLHINGSYAEYACVPEDSLVRLPENVSFEEAATLPIAGLTAYHALVTVGKLKESEALLIWGGSGGLGTFSIQIAKHLGARVIATVGRDEKRAALLKLEADHVFNHHKDDMVSALRDVTEGAGVEVVLDSVGAETFPKSFQLLKKGGRLLLCGKLTGLDVTLSLHQTYLRHLSVLGLYLGEKHELATLLNWVAEGTIKPVIYRTFALKDAAEAQRMMAAGEHIGKLVLKL